MNEAMNMPRPVLKTVIFSKTRFSHFRLSRCHMADDPPWLPIILPMINCELRVY